ncbi:gamma-glutamyl-gamma-aminobutyrate hydrolase family protein [Paenibacillus flagellatus]|uniref:Uncharacterized protein n=1 Tax=Paenibacillus flagellatus TaxID=2211139 RepID=A0A2V5K700_9BACL|nr:gamma-glutamyl-gamma-aminobutyrate hydrolase family protein [Paenibacillus flagellatus]PYI55191.1 hypothetical protein DLM86_11755 [Paenibacillus flagellatus]
MKPIIAVTANYEDDVASLKHAYTDSVRNAGGLPLAVPFGLDEDDVRRLCASADGLLLTGGPDVDPDYYGEEPLPVLGKVTPERDRLEVLLARTFAAAGKPIFAICRGEQVLNVALGGSLYQDIGTEAATLQHSQKAPRSHLSHRVRAEEGSLIERIAGASSFKVNSFHHQAVKRPAPGMRISAKSEDGVVEAIESETHRFVLGVQWHPEDTAATDGVSRKLFEAFVDACRS